jgi:hypothetical protein
MNMVDGRSGNLPEATLVRLYITSGFRLELAAQLFLALLLCIGFLALLGKPS